MIDKCRKSGIVIKNMYNYNNKVAGAGYDYR